METPSARKQLRVDAQSCAVEKFEISDFPRASAAIRAARCEIDLSPGNRNRPFIDRAGLSFMLSGYVRDETLKPWICYKYGIPADVSSLSKEFPQEIQCLKRLGKSS
jgi:hypothetical protein